MDEPDPRAAKALLEEDRDAIFHAAFLDPRTAATLPLGEIREMTEALIARHGEWLPDWCHGGSCAGVERLQPYVRAVSIASTSVRPLRKVGPKAKTGPAD